MKKNKLYTANKWNQPAFMSPRGNNLFWGDPGSSSQMNISGDPSIAEYKSAYTKGDYGSIYTGGNYDVDAAKSAVYGGGSTGDTGAASSGSKGFGKAAALQATAGVGLEVADNMGRSGDNKRGLWDVADPMHHLAGGRESAVGNALGDAGVGLFKAGAQSGNPWLMLAGGVSKFLGSGINGLVGTKVDKVALDRANRSINTNMNFVSNAETLDELRGPASMTQADVYTGSLFNSADDKNEALRRDMRSAFNWADASMRNNARNIISDKYEDNMRRFSAFGGPLNIAVDNNDMGAINYGFMQDYLTNKKQEISNRNKMAGLTQMPAFMPNSFAIGGDLQVNGGDWTTGLTHIDAGLSHEENPNEGVQLGVDSEGIPNLVEENETVWNDYVFSNRILADEATKQMFRLPKKKDITFADISKRLEKEIAERPNDPISRSGFEKQMGMLEEQQERQKQEMEAERAKAAFDALSPEEQTAIMQRAAQEEQMAQQAAQEQAIAEQQAAQQPSPEEMAMVQQQQMMQADGSDAALGQEPQTMAEGGNLYSGEQKGSSKMRNAGTWKKGTSAENWNAYTRNGLRDYLSNIVQRINMAPDDKTKNEIRQEAIKTVGDIQQAYAKAYQKNITPSERNDAVETLQTLFQNANGNAYFNKIADNINLPVGHNTSDTAEQGWVDGFWGPRTSIRNWGSTEYGDTDSYRDLSDLAKQAGLVYAPNEAWRYGDNILYGLSMPAHQEVEAEEKPSWTPEWQGEQPQVSAPSPSAPATTGSSSTQPPAVSNDDGEAPRHKWGWLRYAGLLGPAIGLGMQALGIGKPDTGAIDAAVQGAGDVNTAKWKPLGNYLTYRPLDIWYQQNALNAQARATDRAVLNQSSPSRMAGLLASGYNSQLASGNLFRQAQEYNDNLRKQVEDFNRGTNQFNSEQYGVTSRFNTDARNRARQANAQLRLHAAAQKADMDAGWNQGIYGNVAGLFKGLGDIGRENEQFNWLSDLAADGAFGNLGTSNTSKRWTKDKKAKGGKMKKKGLTI